MPANTSPSKWLPHGHITNVRRVLGRRRRRGARIRPLPVECQFHGSCQLKILLPIFPVYSKKRSIVRHHLSPLNQVILHQKLQQFHITSRHHHRFSEGLGEQSHSQVHFLLPHYTNPKKPRFQFLMVAVVSEKVELLELFIGQNTPVL